MENPTHRYYKPGTFRIYHTPIVGGIPLDRKFADSVVVWPRLSDYSVGASGGFEETVEGLDDGTRVWIDLEKGLMGESNPLTLFPPGTAKRQLGRKDLAFSFKSQCRRQLCPVTVPSGDYETAFVRTKLNSYYDGDGPWPDYFTNFTIYWEAKARDCPTMGPDLWTVTQHTFDAQINLKVAINETYTTLYTYSTPSFTFSGDCSEMPTYPGPNEAYAAAVAAASPGAFGYARFWDGWNYQPRAAFMWDVPNSDYDLITLRVRKGWSRDEKTGKLINSGTSLWVNDEWWMDLTTLPNIGGDYWNGEQPGTGWVYVYDELHGNTIGGSTLLTVSVPEFKYYPSDPISYLWFPTS